MGVTPISNGILAVLAHRDVLFFKDAFLSSSLTQESQAKHKEKS